MKKSKKTNSNLQAKDKTPFLQDVATQCDQESQEKRDAKKKFNKNLSKKDEENSLLRDLNQRLLTQFKELKDEKHNKKLEHANQDLENKVNKKLIKKR
jgi:hypothetical protein